MRRTTAMSVPDMRSTIHRQGVDRSTLFGRELPIPRGGVRTYLLRLRGPGDHGRHGRMREEPREGELQERALPAPREMDELLDNGEILIGEGVAAFAQPRALRDGLPASVLPRQQSACEREIGNEREAGALALGEYIRLRLAMHETVLILHADELGVAGTPRLVGVAQLLDREIRAADLPHFARTNELVERAECVGDRSIRIGRVELKKIDVISAEPGETGVGGATDVCRLTPAVWGRGLVAELRGDDGVPTLAA